MMSARRSCTAAGLARDEPAMHDPAVSYVRWVVAALVLRAGTAHAECPTTVDDPVCRPWTAMFLPTAFGVVYAPHDAQGTWYGGGFEATLLVWSDNTPAFGPSQGRLRFDVAA